MELWIRSQDRETIIKTNIIETKKYDEGYGIISYMDASHTYGLGLYKTKERALEVLDEIQERIINLQLVSLEEKGKARDDVFHRHYLECVYEMPED